MAARALATSVVVVGVILLLLGPRTWAFFGSAIANAQLHAPRLELIARAPATIQIHLATVLAAFALATVQMFGPKGTRIHRALGWTLVALFIVTAIDSLFIRAPGGGPFNPFQVFSVWTLIAIPLAVIAARRHSVVFHARMMSGFYIGALIIAGVLTFLPGRLLWRVFFG
jgi:uncharacterized membrane protein